MLLLETNIPYVIRTVLGDRYLESSVGTQLLYRDANNLYRYAMSQYSPTGEFEQIIVDDLPIILQTPINSDYGYFKRCKLEYPAEMKQVIENLHLCPYQTEAYKDCFSEYMNSIKQIIGQPPN